MLFVIGPRVDPATLVPLSSLGLFMNGTRTAGDSAHNGTGEEDFAFSDTDADDAPDVGLGDYSMRFEELMSDSEEDGRHGGDEEDEDEEEGFIYNGVDSDPTSGYREQLRQVLGPDHEEEEAEEDREADNVCRGRTEIDYFMSLKPRKAIHFRDLDENEPAYKVSCSIHHFGILTHPM